MIDPAKTPSDFLTDHGVTPELQTRKKVLVVRPDRIGDVVLSTPVLEALKVAYPQLELHLLVREAVAPVVEHNPFIDKLILYQPETVHRGVGGFWRLFRQLNQERYDFAITLQVRFRISFALFLARVRHRIGPFSKAYSYLLFNRGRRQRRSAVEMHEADYNMMLLRQIGVRTATRQFETRIVPDSEALVRTKIFLKTTGVDENPFVAVHPGMGGSALNWPEGYYVDLIVRLADQGVPVVVTGSVMERPLVERVIAAVKAQDSSRPVHAFVGTASRAGLHDLIALLSMAKVVVAPSTGPLHIAVALRRNTVSFFPPIRVQSALRWGPYASADKERMHTILVPDTLCRRDYKCAGRGCHFYFCMERLGVEEAFKAVNQHLESKDK